MSIKYLWNGQQYRLPPGSAPFLNKWVFVRICFETARNTINFFINNTSINIAILSPLTMEPTTDFMIGNRLDEANTGFIGYITDFRITFDNLCENNTTPSFRLGVSDKTALLISPVDTNPYADLAKKNNITNYATRFATDYPISLFTNNEGFQTTSSNTNNNKSLKMYLLILLIVIFIILLLNQLKIINM